MQISVTTAPAGEPVTTTEAKNFLREYSGDANQDGVLGTLIAAARQRMESYLRSSLVTQSLTWTMTSEEADPSQDRIRLPFGPVTGLTKLTTYDADGVGTEYTPSGVGSGTQLVDSDGTVIAELVGDEFLVPRNDSWTLSRDQKAAALEYVAGFGSVANWAAPGLGTPMEAIKGALLVTINDFYEDRGSVVAGTIIAEIHHSARARVHRYRRGLG